MNYFQQGETFRGDYYALILLKDGILKETTKFAEQNPFHKDLLYFVGCHGENPGNRVYTAWSTLFTKRFFFLFP